MAILFFDFALSVSNIFYSLIHHQNKKKNKGEKKSMAEAELEKHLELYIKAHTFSKSKEPHSLSHIWKPASVIGIYVNKCTCGHSMS